MGLSQTTTRRELISLAAAKTAGNKQQAWNRTTDVIVVGSGAAGYVAEKGPYFCVMLGGGTLDTNGGPRICARARILDFNGRPIPGLFGAGNCIASPAGKGYRAGGATIGLAMTFGAVAGSNVAKRGPT